MVFEEPSKTPFPERFLSWVLGWPLVWLLTAFSAIHFLFWLPQQLVLPMYADHDVFATMAKGWQVGLLPYRDLIGNNFPGTIYLFWAFGRLFGWGNPTPFYAFDAILLVGFAGLLVIWSVRRFGHALPGVLGASAFLAYFFNLDFTQGAQRDSQGPIFAVAGLLIVQAWPGRVSRLISALVLAIGTTIRPQVLLFVPAYWMALDESARPQGGPRLRSVGAVAEWCLVVAALVALGLLPLALSGILGDFLRGLRSVAYGSSYNEVGLGKIARRIFSELKDLRLLLIFPLVILLGGGASGDRDRKLSMTWLVALFAIALYLPLSPVMHSYMYHPIQIVLTVFVAILAHIVLNNSTLSTTLRFLFVLLILGQTTSLKPKFINLTVTRDAITSLKNRTSPKQKPAAYEFTTYSLVNSSIIRLYPLDDYRAMIAHLRTMTAPSTRVANVLIGVAVTGPADRLPAFPAESAAWLVVVRSEDEPRFVESLIQTPDSVVVWNPTFTNVLEEVPNLAATIRRLYEPSARFGEIEVWVRKPEKPGFSGIPDVQPVREAAKLLKVQIRGKRPVCLASKN